MGEEAAEVGEVRVLMEMDSRAGEVVEGLRVRDRSAGRRVARRGGLAPGIDSASLLWTEERLDLLLMGLVGGGIDDPAATVVGESTRVSFSRISLKGGGVEFAASGSTKVHPR